MSGEAINSAVAQGSSDFEIQLILVMAVIVILGLLLITSEAWFEPVLFLSVIGISIVYNLGTNIIFRRNILYYPNVCRCFAVSGLNGLRHSYAACLPRF